MSIPALLNVSSANAAAAPMPEFMMWITGAMLMGLLIYWLYSGFQDYMMVRNHEKQEAEYAKIHSEIGG